MTGNEPQSLEELIGDLGLGFRLGTVVSMLVQAEGHMGGTELKQAREQIDREIARRERLLKADAVAMVADGPALGESWSEGSLRDRIVGLLRTEAPKTFHVRQLKGRLALNEREYRLLTKIVSVLNRTGMIRRHSRGIYGVGEALKGHRNGR